MFCFAKRGVIVAEEPGVNGGGGCGVELALGCGRDAGVVGRGSWEVEHHRSHYVRTLQQQQVEERRFRRLAGTPSTVECRGKADFPFSRRKLPFFEIALPGSSH